mgnify:CR=1 FL=1
MLFDAIAGTVSVTIDDDARGVLFRGLAGQTLFPAVATYISSRSVRILRCELLDATESALAMARPRAVGTSAGLGDDGALVLGSGPGQMAGTTAYNALEPELCVTGGLAISEDLTTATSMTSTTAQVQTAEGFTRCFAIDIACPDCE